MTPLFAQGVSRPIAFPHPANATRGIPDTVASYNVRLNAFRQQNTDGTAETDLGGQLSYGLSEIGGLHLRSLGVRTAPLTEVIGMVSLWRDASRQQGISFISIVGLPTGRQVGEEHRGLSYLAGFSGRLTQGTFIIQDMILNYDFTTKHYTTESGTVIRFAPNVFGAVDTRTSMGRFLPVVMVMPSVKVRVSTVGFLGLGYTVLATLNSGFQHQVFVQWEVGNH